MRILILGGDGMLGHQLLESWQQAHDVRVTLRRSVDAYEPFGLFTRANSVGGIDAHDLPAIRDVVQSWRPEGVVNCIGIVKQRSDAKAAIPSIEINALLPHHLLEMCEAAGARLVHVSTDCVFSGEKGNYRETDRPDPVDLYGRSKLLGEVETAPGFRVRTSIIGLELSRFTGLIEWFLAQRGMIRGFTRAIYSGVTTRELARVLAWVLENGADLNGVWQVASQPITKYDVLVELARLLGRDDVNIVADDSFVCDRSLCGDAFVSKTGYRVSTWETMLSELADDIKARGRAR